MFWFFTLTAAATLGIWLGVLGDQLFRRRSAHPSRGASRTELEVRWLIVLAWAYSVLPPLLGIATTGRQPLTAGTLVVATSSQRLLSTFIAGIIATLALWIIVDNVSNRPASRLAILAAFLAPWFLIQIIPGLAASYIAGPQVFLYPIIAVALWLASPPLRVLSTLGYAVIVTAAASIVAVAFSPASLVNVGPAGTDKALITSGPELLAGPFNHSNSLGLVLALGAPSITLLRDRLTRTLGLAVVSLAILWSASRTSVIAIAMVLALYLIRRVSTTQVFRTSAACVVAGTAVLSVWLPFAETDPLSFSQRGMIWIASRDVWANHVWLGSGPKFFERANELGFFALYGHNLPIDALARAGLAGALGLIVFGLVALKRASYAARESEYPLLAVVSLVSASLLEVPLLFDNLGILGFVTWIPLAVIFFSRDTRVTLPRPTRKAFDGAVTAQPSFGR